MRSTPRNSSTGVYGSALLPPLACLYSRPRPSAGGKMSTRRGFGRNAPLWGIVLSAGLIFILGAPAQAVPAAEAPVYAIGNYPFQKAPALMRWRSVLQREADLMGRANADACKDGEPRLDCAA